MDDLKVFMPRRSRSEDIGVDIVKFLDEKGIRRQYDEIDLTRVAIAEEEGHRGSLGVLGG